MVFFYPIFIIFMWIALQLSYLWGELYQQRRYFIQELEYLSAYYLAQSGLTLALTHPWENIKGVWQCQQQDEFKFCVKLLNQSIALIQAGGRVNPVSFSTDLPYILLYQLAKWQLHNSFKMVRLQKVANGWLDVCPIANDKICLNAVYE